VGHRGQTLTIKASGLVKETIEEGAYVQLQVKYGYIRLINTQADLCEQIKNVNLECPIEQGLISIVKDVDLPNEIPPVSTKIRVVADGCHGLSNLIRRYRASTPSMPTFSPKTPCILLVCRRRCNLARRTSLAPGSISRQRELDGGLRDGPLWKGSSSVTLETSCGRRDWRDWH
jgi:hypothetical protein